MNDVTSKIPNWVLFEYFFWIESEAMAGFKKFTELSLTLMEAKTKDLGIESHLSERVKWKSMGKITFK